MVQFAGISFRLFVVFEIANFGFAENPEETAGYLEGDIVSIAPSLLAGLTRAGLSDTKYRWPNATIPYQFQSGYASLSQVTFRQATQHISDRTCIKFKPRTNERDYLEVISDNRGCYSHLGRIGGKQAISLPPKCRILGVHIHELIHAIGFHHEQTRTDRDEFVTINNQNIQPGMGFNFQKLGPKLVSTFDVPYDYDSVMHYTRTAFTRNGRDTIVPKKSNVRIGQRRGMSSTDAKKVNNMYCKNTRNDNNAQQPQLKIF